MTLLQCPECGHTVSDAARACPGCGAPPPIGPHAPHNAGSKPEPEPASREEVPASREKATNPWTITSHPWRRYFARQFDIALATMLLMVLLRAFSSTMRLDQDIGRGLVFISMLLWVFGETFCLVTFGTTPGKALLSTRVRDASGRLPSFGAAARRSVRVWFFGCAVGIPILALITLVVAASKLLRTGKTSWDAKENLRVEHGDLRPVGVAVIVATAVLSLIGLVVAATS